MLLKVAPSYSSSTILSNEEAGVPTVASSRAISSAPRASDGTEKLWVNAPEVGVNVVTAVEREALDLAGGVREPFDAGVEVVGAGGGH